jgi:hypothetical protein
MRMTSEMDRDGQSAGERAGIEAKEALQRVRELVEQSRSLLLNHRMGSGADADPIRTGPAAHRTQPDLPPRGGPIPT